MLKLLLPMIFIMSGGFWFYKYFDVVAIRRIAGAVTFASALWGLAAYFPNILQEPNPIEVPAIPTPQTVRPLNKNPVSPPADIPKVETPPERILTAPATKVVIEKPKGSPLVKELQVALITKGCYNGPVDGVFGSQTSNSLKEFNATNLTNITKNNLDNSSIEIVTSDNSFVCNRALSRKTSTCFSWNGETRCE